MLFFYHSCQCLTGNTSITGMYLIKVPETDGLDMFAICIFFFSCCVAICVNRLTYDFLQITGSDDENYPFTRKVQRDIWSHQHPSNCRDPNVRFLVADWEVLPGFGMGAQIAGMCGMLAIAINEKRVLVTNYFNRADHDGCEGI